MTRRRRESAAGRRHRPRALLGAVVMAVAPMAAACGGSDEPNATTQSTGQQIASKATADESLAKLVPPKIRKRGKLVIATNAPYAPLEYFDEDNKTLIGFDIDIGNAVGKVLGLDVEWKNTSFDSIIPGLAAGRYDIGMAGFSAERERLKVVDFVSYYLTGGGFLVKKGSGVRVNDYAETVCGHTAAVQKGTSQVDRLHEAQKSCAAKGKPLKVLEIPDQNVVVVTLNSGRADVVVADKPQVEYAAGHSNGKLCVTGTYRTAHSITGIAVPKRLSQFDVALQRGVNRLLENGEYQRIAKKWGVGVRGATNEIDPTSVKIAKPWGVGPDGSVRESKVFTDPEQIDPTERIFPQSIREGCA